MLGAFRLLRPSGSYRAAAGAAVAYTVLPLPYGALAEGRWGPLAVYAAAPWLLAGLARAGAMAPMRRRPVARVAAAGDDGAAAATEIDLRDGTAAARSPPCPLGRPPPGSSPVGCCARRWSSVW